MTLPLAVALLALLVALFCLVALVAVYARVRALEATRTAFADPSGYAPLTGRPAPAAVAPRPGERGAVVAVVDADCALCHAVWDALGAADVPGLRRVAVADRDGAFAPGPAELVVDPAVRAALFEGYSPTLLVLDATGTVAERTFVYADTDVPALLRAAGSRHGADHEGSRA
ncbi:MAG: hypothetical protein NTW05_28485 [Pseudonocardiales bacterium]|jgi:hypothetical protein|nr:hypothetical protein [Pseudonocardiales bacterium]